MPDDTDPRPERPPQLRRVRRAPKFPAFIASGGLIGLIVGVLLGLRGGTGDYSVTATVALFALIFLGIGILAGAAVAVVLDRRSLR